MRYDRRQTHYTFRPIDRQTDRQAGESEIKYELEYDWNTQELHHQELFKTVARLLASYHTRNLALEKNIKRLAYNRDKKFIKSEEVNK